ncbi:MAG: multiheme c-type cytochrome ExtKL [Desulfobulbales bacterium]|nr:multiheme c-type cytochrome ExtKL [Desulfobulbales bacterium]
MKFIKVFLVVFLVMIPMSAFGQKAKTIDELAAMYDSSRCKECHAEIYARWENSHHARSLMGVQDGLMMTPLALKGLTPFSPDDPGKATLDTFPCFKCHLPQALVSADDAFAVDYARALVAQDKAKVSKLRITCIVCHNTKAIIHQLSEGPPEEKVLYGTKDVASHDDEFFTKIKKGSIIDHAIMCGQCHGLGPNLEFKNPVQCATLYGSYEHNYISKGGTQQCQECHMQEVDGFADHLIAPNWNDLEGTKKILQDTISMDVQTVGYEWLLKSKDLKPMVVVNTKINQNAGHRIPDG